MNNALLLKLTTAAMVGAEKLVDRAMNGEYGDDGRKVMLERAENAFSGAMRVQIETERTITLLAEAERKAYSLDDCEGGPDDCERTVYDAIAAVLKELGQATREEIVSELEDEFAYSAIESAISTMRSNGKVVGVGLRFKPAYWALTERGVVLNDIPSYLEEISQTAAVKDLYASGMRRSEIANRLGLEYSEVVNLRLRDGKVSVMVYDTKGSRAVPQNGTEFSAI